MRLARALLLTGLATIQWWCVEQFAIVRLQYTPGYLTSLHVHQPAYMLPAAWLSTACAALCWVRAIRSASDL